MDSADRQQNQRHQQRHGVSKAPSRTAILCLHFILSAVRRQGRLTMTYDVGGHQWHGASIKATHHTDGTGHLGGVRNGGGGRRMEGRGRRFRRVGREGGREGGSRPREMRLQADEGDTNGGRP